MIFDVGGYNLDQFPNEAIGVLSMDNDRPDQFKNSTWDGYIVNIQTKERRRMLLDGGEHHFDVGNYYLGLIVSSDRQTVYWINDTKPLP